MNFWRRLFAIGTVALLCGALTVSSAAATGSAPLAGLRSSHPGTTVGRGVVLGDRALPAPAATSAVTPRSPIVTQGYLVPNQGAYVRTKVAADARSARLRRTSPAKAATPGIVATPELGAVHAWAGLSQQGETPSDSTGAIGPTRYIEIVNSHVDMYARTGSSIGNATMQSLMGDSSTRPVSDPQMMWDPGTNRWYYAGIDDYRAVYGTDLNYLLFGWSKTASPTTLGSKSWCQLAIYYGTGSSNILTDYPKLGDTSNFLLIGHNDFSSAGAFVRTAVSWITKPRNGVTTCPTSSTFPKFGLHATPAPGGGYTWTPEPAKQTDTSGTGYVLSSDYVGGGGSSSALYEYSVTRSSTGNAVFSAPATITIPSYSAPPAAAQPGTPEMLDTLDGRLLQTVSAYDPSRAAPGVWTENTVLDTDPAFSAVQWYELNPVTHTVAATGLIDDGAHFFFNAAVSPDRRRSGTSGIYGDSAVIGFNTSSSTDFAAVQEESVGPAFTSAGPQLIAQNPYVEADDFCGSDTPDVCRWGDYSGATPDPASAADAAHGVVWLSNMLVGPTPNPGDGVQWTTENWAATPNFDAALTGPSTILQKNLSSVPAWNEVGTYAGTSPTPHYSTQVNIAPYNAAFAGFVPDETNTTATSGTLQTVAEGTTYCFEASVVDNSSFTWEASRQRCMATPKDDRALTRSTGWSAHTGTGWFDSTYLSTTGSGHSLTLPGVQALRVGIVVGRCGTCGSVKVYLGSTLLKTVSLHASTFQKDVVLSVATFTSVRTGTLKIVSATSGKPIDIDGVVTSRA
jgi:hypothetical protein